MPPPYEPCAAELEGAVIRSSGAKIAVIIPTFNHARFLGDAIESVLAQTLKPDEIIVVDDGSSDDPASVVAQFPKIRLIRQENRGRSGARNTGLWSSRADYVVFLDADDRLLPKALEVGLACSTVRPDCAFVYGAFRLVSERCGTMEVVYPEPIDGDAYISLLRQEVVIAIMTMFFRRDCLVAVNGFDKTLSTAEDLDLKLRITKNHPIACHFEVVAEYRRHDLNISNNFAEMLKGALEALDRQNACTANNALIHAAWREGRSNRRRYYVSQMLGATAARWRIHHDVGDLVADLAQAARWSPMMTGRALLSFIGRSITKIVRHSKMPKAKGKVVED